MYVDQEGIHNAALAKATENILRNYVSIVDGRYHKEMEELEKNYQDQSKLPSKIGLSETDNLAYDHNRLLFICRALQFFARYYATGKTSLLVSLPPQEKEAWDILCLVNSRTLLEHITFTIFNLSGELRGKYKHLLLPKPFTWETFEQLGGIMKTAPNVWQRFILRGMSGEVAQRFMDESLSTENIVEAAVQTIIDDDIPKLMQLFEYILAAESKSAVVLPVPPPVCLLSIKALTRRIYDTESLDILLKNSDNQCTEMSHHDLIDKVKKRALPGKKYMVTVDDNNPDYKRNFDLSTKLGKHAALRRLEKIGEWLKGKNLSSFIADLDPTIDWNAFIIVRDTIAHQDEKDNKAKIAALLANEAVFIKILSDEMQSFFHLLCQLVVLRDQKYPRFEKNPDAFWKAVYAYEKEVQRVLSEQSKLTAAPVFKQRVSTDDITFFMGILNTHKVQQEIQLRWLGILDGHGNLPNKMEYGALLKHLPSRKENKDLSQRCKAIADKATDERTDAAEREEARKKQQEEAQKRQAREEAAFKGFTELRALARQFKGVDDRSQYLKPVKRIEAAIEALENIKEFMEQDRFVHANFNFPTIDEWNKTQTEGSVLEFYARLLSSPEFNDAIEYNAAQLLQHLNTIQTYPEAKGCQYLDQDYEAIRCLRNWVEHGNPLFDKKSYDPGKKPDLLDNLQKTVDPVMITLIFKLLPALKKMKVDVTNRFNQPLPQPLPPVQASPKIAPDAAYFKPEAKQTSLANDKTTAMENKFP